MTATTAEFERLCARMQAVFRSGLPLRHKMVLIALNDFRGRNTVAWPSTATLAAACSISRGHLMRVLGELVADGVLIRHPRRDDERGKISTLYEIDFAAMIGSAGATWDVAPALQGESRGRDMGCSAGATWASLRKEPPFEPPIRTIPPSSAAHSQPPKGAEREIAQAADELIPVGFASRQDDPQASQPPTPAKTRAVPPSPEPSERGRNSVDRGAFWHEITGDDNGRAKPARKPWTQRDLVIVYEEYPRHVGKAAALKSIEKALRAIAERGEADPVGWLRERVRAFAASDAGQAGQFTPLPATWMNQGRYDDDPRDWRRGEAAPAPKPAGDDDPVEAALRRRDQVMGVRR